MIDYLVICVETANENAASICHLEFASVRSGRIVGRLSKYIDPKDEFDPFFSCIHGIGPDAIGRALDFSSIYKELVDMMDGQIIVTPSIFDRIAFTKAAQKNNLVVPNVKWVDLACVIKNAWPEHREASNNLRAIAEYKNAEISTQGVLQKASLVIEIVQSALATTDDIADWTYLRKPLSTLALDNGVQRRRREFDGEELVFEGDFFAPVELYSRLAAGKGFTVSRHVSRTTTIICMGLQGLSSKLESANGSNLAVAAALMRDGIQIRLIDEDDLWNVISETGDPIIEEIENFRHRSKLKEEEGLKYASSGAITLNEEVQDSAANIDTGMSVDVQVSPAVKKMKISRFFIML